MADRIPAYIDLHCDNVLLCDEVYAKRDDIKVVNMRKSNSQMDLLRMKKANCMAQFYAIFVHEVVAKQQNITVQEEFERLYKIQIEQINKNKDLVKLARNSNDLLQNIAEGKISAFLAIEDGGVVDSVTRLDDYYNKGIRYITLVWNRNSGLGHPADNDNSDFCYLGLTQLGKEVVEAMNHKKIIIDISHANAKTANEVLDITKVPVIASHSGVSAVFNHHRNLDDKILKSLANKGGIVGIVYYEEFLQKDKEAPNTFAVIKRHIDHVVNIAGIESVALGSDFDGYSHNAKSQVKDVLDVPLLGKYLLDNGYNEVQLEKIFNGNALRVIKDVL